MLPRGGAATPKPDTMEPARGYYNSFVVKIWCDPTSGRMTGHIQHVSSQTYQRFLNLADMNRFILDRVTADPDDSVTGNTAQIRSATLAGDLGGSDEGG
jgi:hypothetical protein